MARKVLFEQRGVVTRNSGHTAKALLDVCLTPSPAGMVPIPYVNTVSSRHLRGGSSHVFVQGASVMLSDSSLTPSCGNEAGRGGGVISRTTRGRARALSYSAAVKIEGRGVVRSGDRTRQNDGNAVGAISS